MMPQPVCAVVKAKVSQRNISVCEFLFGQLVYIIIIKRCNVSVGYIFLCKCVKHHSNIHAFSLISQRLQ